MSFIKTLVAYDFIKMMPNSSTEALLVLCDDGREFVLKHGAGDVESGGRNVLVAEYLSYLLARFFRLRIPEYCFVVVGKKFRNTIRHQRVAELLKECPDICIGSEYIRWTEPFQRSHAKLVKNPDLLAAIFGFDQYIYNFERMKENPNLLYDSLQRNVYMIDHSHAMWKSLDFAKTITDTVVTSEAHLLCRDHIKNKNIIVPLVKDMFDKVIDQYVDSVPDPWFTKDFSATYVRRLLKTRRDSIVDILAGVHQCI